MEVLLAEHEGLRKVLGLRRAPDHTTLWRAQTHLTPRDLDRLLHETVRLAKQNGLLQPAATEETTVIVDSTGLSSSRASRHFYRRTRTQRRAFFRYWPKWSVAIDRRSHIILGQVARRGPRSDHVEFKRLVQAAQKRRRSWRLLADAGYDSAANLRWCRDVQAIDAVIKVKPHPTAKSLERIMSPERRRLYLQFPKPLYGQRWQVESMFAAHKRRFGDVITSRAFYRRNREILLRGVLHNCSILLPKKDRNRATKVISAGNSGDTGTALMPGTVATLVQR